MSNGDPDSAAAIWSAVAASFAAFAAFLSWRAQLRTLHQTFRPEVVISGWGRDRSPTIGDAITFCAVSNVGRESALQVLVNASGLADDNRQTYVMSTLDVPIIAAGATASVQSEIQVTWSNVAGGQENTKTLVIEVSAWYWDALNFRHCTDIRLLVAQQPSEVNVGAAQIADGVYLLHRRTRSVAVWWLKLSRALSRIPLLGRLVRADA